MSASTTTRMRTCSACKKSIPGTAAYMRRHGLKCKKPKTRVASQIGFLRSLSFEQAIAVSLLARMPNAARRKGQ